LASFAGILVIIVVARISEGLYAEAGDSD